MNKLVYVFHYQHTGGFADITLDNPPRMSSEQLTAMANMFEKDLKLDRDDKSCLFCVALYDYDYEPGTAYTADVLWFKRNPLTYDLQADYWQRGVEDVRPILPGLSWKPGRLGIGSQDPM